MKHTPLSRRFRQGSLSGILAILFLAVIVLLNVVVTTLTERNGWRIDLTADQAFVLTDSSKEFLAGLDEPINIYLLLPEQNLTSAGDYFMQANEIIGQYAVHSDQITVEYVDLTRNPGFSQRFPQYQLASSTIILETERQTTTLSVYDLFEIESDNNQDYYIVASKAEQVMTSTMMGLTMAHPPTVSILTGFGESGTDALSSLLTQNRYTVVEQNLITEDLHPDATLVVVSAPARDYSLEVLEKLDAFLYHDGQLGRSLLYFAGLGQAETPNLDAFLADWGIAVEEGAVFQTDTSRLVVESYYWSVVDYAEEAYSKGVIDAQLYTVIPEARPLTVLFSQKGQREVTELLTFDEGVCVSPVDNEDWLPSQAERWGPIPAMLRSRQTGYDGEETLSSSVIVCASERMMDAYLMQSPYVGNAEYLLAVTDDLVARDGVTLTSKTIGGTYLMMSEFQIALIAAIFVVMLPLAILIVGGAVFIHRKHL